MTSATDDRTPPMIVAAAMDQTGALTAFIAQELGQWGFGVEARKLEAQVIVNADGYRFVVEVSRVH